ncbi:MAG: bifunctional isocitrate dehydrogenase kinase/phosphatase [Desulfobacterales bacterium]|jgi:isocitrate dehydrogenase kinase/phosphatase
MNQVLSDSRLANLGAQAILESFNAFHSSFKDITRRAAERFLNRDWHGLQDDAAERLDLYRQAADTIEDIIRRLLGERVKDKLTWAGMKAVYSGRIFHQNDRELAETFFNSITRRIFSTVGVDSRIEFVDSDFDTPPTPSIPELGRSYAPEADPVDSIRAILEDCGFGSKLKDPAGQAAVVARRIRHQLAARGKDVVVERIDMVGSLFFRNKEAYLVGRIVTASDTLPLSIALHHPPGGIVVDAVLLDEDSLSILFSFTRSYFLVCAERPYNLVHFLKSIIPHKRTAELYTTIGYNKHGKTELYRDIVGYTLECTNEQFEFSPGQRGMVMIVFNMAQDDLVIKLIRDRFRNPKNTTRRAVVEKYDLVFKHDRAGRLVEAHAFEYLKFDRCWFSDELLDELLREAAEMVEVVQDEVILRHAYVERRVTPLDIYLPEAEPSAAASAVIDYGKAIKDLAVSNIFPGDMLLKNFGVTRHRRVVFYDYDELCPLIDCHFRKLPPPRTTEDELESDPWFFVDENDVFPEEFPRFLGLAPDLLEVFMEHHSDLFDVEFWQKAQAAIRGGEIISVLPYLSQHRLP